MTSNEAHIYQIDKYDSSLRIHKATTAHNGNYTCVASNDAAKAAHTQTLLVHGTGEIRLWISISFHGNAAILELGYTHHILLQCVHFITLLFYYFVFFFSKIFSSCNCTTA